MISTNNLSFIRYKCSKCGEEMEKVLLEEEPTIKLICKKCKKTSKLKNFN